MLKKCICGLYFDTTAVYCSSCNSELIRTSSEYDNFFKVTNYENKIRLDLFGQVFIEELHPMVTDKKSTALEISDRLINIANGIKRQAIDGETVKIGSMIFF